MRALDMTYVFEIKIEDNESESSKIQIYLSLSKHIC